MNDLPHNSSTYNLVIAQQNLSTENNLTSKVSGMTENMLGSLPTAPASRVPHPDHSNISTGSSRAVGMTNRALLTMSSKEGESASNEDI